MKARTKISVFIASLALSVSLSAQPGIEQLLKKRPVFTQKWDETVSSRQYTLKMDFAGFTITNPGEYASLYSKKIQRIDLYYTEFAVSDSFSQSKLNRNRLEEIKKLIPSCFLQHDIEWRFIAQTGLKRAEDGASYFHGFVITYRETEFMDRKTEVMLLDSFSKVIKSSVKDTVNRVECKTVRKVKKTWTGKYIPRSKHKFRKGIRYESRSVWKRKKEFQVTTTFTRCDTVWGSSFTGTFNTSMLNDSVVLKSLERNKDKWKNAVVVTDVTGSMYPYILQLQIWMRLNFIHTGWHNFVFFNDGDDMADHKKKIGKTGGIYSIHAKDFESMDKLCKKAMTAGGGGDGPENNIEAILTAEKEFPAATDIILIADSYAPIKDIKLLKQVNKPVHVILCGSASGYLDPAYLDLARETGGSIHTMEQDITDLIKLSEGKTVKIGTLNYVIRNGQFQLYKST